MHAPEHLGEILANFESGLTSGRLPRRLAEAYESYARTLPGTACVGKMNPTPSPMARRLRGVDSDGSAPPLPAMGDGSPVGGRTLDMDALRSGADADSDADSDAADDGRRVRARLTQI